MLNLTEKRWRRLINSVFQYLKIGLRCDVNEAKEGIDKQRIFTEKGFWLIIEDLKKKPRDILLLNELLRNVVCSYYSVNEDEDEIECLIEGTLKDVEEMMIFDGEYSHLFNGRKYGFLVVDERIAIEYSIDDHIYGLLENGNFKRNYLKLLMTDLVLYLAVLNEIDERKTCVF